LVKRARSGCHLRPPPPSCAWAARRPTRRSPRPRMRGGDFCLPASCCACSALVQPPSSPPRGHLCAGARPTPQQPQPASVKLGARAPRAPVSRRSPHGGAPLLNPCAAERAMVRPLQTLAPGAAAWLHSLPNPCRCDALTASWYRHEAVQRHICVPPSGGVVRSADGVIPNLSSIIGGRPLGRAEPAGRLSRRRWRWRCGGGGGARLGWRAGAADGAADEPRRRARLARRGARESIARGARRAGRRPPAAAGGDSGS
jgi:hypothetical protein